MQLPDGIKLHEIAVQCPEYEPITLVQGFGISFLTNVEATVYPKCDWCLNWYGGTCKIYLGVRHQPSAVSYQLPGKG
ncbi:MAG: hypothetical protein ACYDG6_09555 [Thermincolia bacterium]